MMVRRSALVDRSAGQLFDLIEAAEHYPQFLPWCTGALIVARDETMVSADITVRYKGMQFSFRTRNPKRRPDYMAIHLAHGPFLRFEGEWRLTPLDTHACKVDFALDYEFSSPTMTQATGPLFGRIAGTLVDAFVKRALAEPAEPP
jgi:ribosome-associated toxin RatA of RatAB toxin-antitoxin module